MTRARVVAALCGLAVALGLDIPAGAAGPMLGPTPAPSQPQGSPGPSAAPSTLPARPDIIVVYVDDVAPLDGRLWTEERTPEIRRWILDRGLTFQNAVDEAPLCCPARANLLTGLHTHNNGVTRNDASLFDPRETIATELHGAGYHTAWIGKYLNRYMSMRGPRRLAHESPWDTFQPMSGGSHGYYLWPKGTPRSVRPPIHSMRLVQRLTVRELRDAPVDQPLFAVLSTYAGHVPNSAMPEFRGSARCSDIARWKPPSYGWAAAADKPDWMRHWVSGHQTRVPAAGVPLVKLCEDMLGVDELVGLVARQQAARGRLDDTLLILASDNGFLNGEYGWFGKQVPWAVPVVLAMAWPQGMGTIARTTAVPTSNIDLAPTLCAIGGCAMGPYPSGQVTADGVSLLPVMLGESPPPRTALLTVMLAADPITGMPAWTSVTTYPGDALGRWHYIRWATGQRQLYDLAADPWELRDVATDPATVGVMQALEERRLSLLAGGRVALPSASPAAGG